MITLIYGGSSSGKSAFAENYVCASKCKNKYYMATMSANDNESIKRVNNHRKMRSGKGFVTLEQPVDIVDAIYGIDQIDQGDFSTEGNDDIILLECLSNLVANEMFRDGLVNSSDYCVAKIIDDLKKLSQKVSSIVIVSNNIFEDGREYDAGTKDYLRALGTLNQKLSVISDEVYEVVVGIGIKIKG